MKQLLFLLLLSFNFVINSTATKYYDLIDNPNIQQCTLEILNSKATNMFEILYNKPNMKLILILNKYKLVKSQMNYEMNILCAYNVDIIRLNLKIEINEDYSCKLNLDDKLIDSKMIRVDRNSDNSQIIYSIDYHVFNSEPQPLQQLDATSTSSSSSQLTFIEKYLLKQDKLNNTVWIYEELALNTIVGYLQTSTNLSAFVSVIKTNLNGYTETFASSQMTFQLLKVFNDEKNNLYALTILKRIDREYVDYFDLSIDLKSGSNLFETLHLRVCLIDINDNVPIFKAINSNGVSQNVSLYKFNLTENQFYYNFAQIYAIDRDLGLNSEVEYEIVSIDRHRVDTESNKMEKIDEPLFRINGNTGYLSLMKKMDREEGDFYRLTIRAIDKGKSIRQRSISFVDIEIFDENDNSPKFLHNKTYNFKIRENIPANTIIANCKAYDQDKNAKTIYNFEPKSFESLFTIDTITGDLYTKDTFDADIGDSLRDNFTNVYKFKIIAKDAERDDLPTDHVNVEVKIEDLNDNEPYLKQTEALNLFLNLNSTNYNKSIIKLVAMDHDFTNLPINFEILFIRKMNLNFMNDILKQQKQNSHENNETDVIYNFISNLKNRVSLTERVQKIQQNLSSIFTLNKNANMIEINNENYLDYFSDGLYNISIKFTDNKIQADDEEHSKQASLNVFLFNNTVSTANNETTELTKTQFDFLLNTIEQWHEKYFKENWTNDYESNYLKSSGLLNEFFTSDNSEYILENNANALTPSDCLLNNLIYYRFDYNVFSSSSRAIKDFYKYNSYNNRHSLLNSNLIIGLISMFVVIAVILIAIVSYKHYKSIHSQDDLQYQESKKDMDSVDNSSNNSFIPAIANSVSTSSIKKSVC